jgi:hypothetical protein
VQSATGTGAEGANLILFFANAHPHSRNFLTQRCPINANQSTVNKNYLQIFGITPFFCKTHSSASASDKANK